MPKRNPGKGVKTMPHDAPRRQNWFARGGRSYALYRPDYPPELPAFLACTSPGRGVAVDVGCGNGQLTVQLAEHFSKVIGTDPSADQIAHATSHDRVEYFRAPAERQPVPDQTADLITAAQAAHWFDMPAFCAEVRRIARSEAVVALIAYGVLRVHGNEVDRIVQAFYRDVIGPYWPPARRHVENGYRELYFPFRAVATPALAIERNWRLPDLLGYVGTWSAVQAAGKAMGRPVIADFHAAMAAAWGGDPDAPRRVTWPLSLRVGRV